MDLAPQMTPEIPQELAEQGEMPPWVLVVLGAAVLCGLLAALAYAMLRLRRFRLGGRTGAVAVRTERRRVQLGAWLGRVLAALRQRLSLFWMLMTERGSPRELYWFLARAGRRLGCRKEPGESPCAFVRRAAEMAAGLSGDLEALAAALERDLYAAPGPRPDFPRQTARRIRRGFRGALRKARRARLAAWLRRRMTGKAPAEN